MTTKYIKVCPIDDDRIKNYTNRLRSRVQIFYTGNDERDFARYRAEGGGSKPGVEMHDKPDTIRIQPPEKHYYAELIDGIWWWVNGCDTCQGRVDDFPMGRCTEHDVCVTCGINRADITETPWATKGGFRCRPCQKAMNDARRAEAFEKMALEEYDEFDFKYNDNVKCPHCGSSYEPDFEVSDGEENCNVCGGKYMLELDHSVTYSTSIIGERLTK